MYRRRYLRLACCAATAGTVPASAPESASSGTPPGVAWQRTYDDFPTQTVVPAHGGGHVIANRGQRNPDSDLPVRIALLDETGVVRRRRRIDPDVPEEARRASADLLRTDAGYAVATGTWFATLDRELSVETTGFASGYASNRGTRLVEASDGFVVASDLDEPSGVTTRVLGFGRGGIHRWTRRFNVGEGQSLTYLGFLEESPEGGVVVGGPGGEPWLASVGPDGGRRWQTKVTDAPSDSAGDATVDDDGITFTGGSGLVHLTRDRNIDWQRSYDALEHASPNTLARTGDGGYVVAAPRDGPGFVLGRADDVGRLQWAWEYSIGEAGPSQIAMDIVERTPGEYLVVGLAGKQENALDTGWALLLSETESPPPTPTATPIRTPSPTDSPTRTPSRTEKPTRSPTEAPTAVPGFGVLAALAGLAGGWLARRR